MRRGRLWVRLAAAGLFGLLAGWPVRSQETPAPSPGAAILEDLRSFREMGTVLYVAAHPDDENNLLLAYLARGRNIRTAYLALNRGEGGQNELGPVFGFELGVVRTQELLEARSVDGARQFFTRVFDFGYSKSPEETLRFWDHDKVLGDVVRIIREFRPDVVITRFSPPPANTHGHHTASTILAQEAFKICGDPKAYPEQIAEGLPPWQPKRLLFNGGGGGTTLRITVSGGDPATGESFQSIAARARSMHKTQGFGNFGGGGRGGAATESFTLLDGEPATQDILDGVDTTWARFPGGAKIGQGVDDAIAKYNPQDPAASAPALLAIKSSLATLPKDPLLEEKRADLDRLIANCLGLSVKTSVSGPEVYAQEVFSLNFSASLSAKIPVRWETVRYAHRTGDPFKPIELVPNQSASHWETYTLPANTAITDPYWLKEPPGDGIFRVDEPDLIGRPENPPVLPVEYVFNVGGQTIVIPDAPKYYPEDTTPKTLPRDLAVIPFVTIHFTSAVKLFAPGQSQPVEVELTDNLGTGSATGNLQLNLPAGWKASPALLPFSIAKQGDKTRLSFTVTAPAQPAKTEITATAEIGGMRFDTDREELKYDHIPLQLLQPKASVKAVALDLAIRGSKIGYLPGAGDDVAACLEQMGYTVSPLTGADLTPEKLKGFDAVVIGVRAFNERKDLAANLPGLFAYVEQGGTVIAQYNRPGNLPQLGPYNLSIAGNAPALRVTDETAPVTILAPDHPALTTPNKIVAADFAGWVQERSAYLASSWDQDHYTQLLAMSDPGETQPSSSILVANYGQGYYVYTSIGWFRQLPAGVPGAYRLFANLVSLGK